MISLNEINPVKIMELEFLGVDQFQEVEELPEEMPLLMEEQLLAPVPPLRRHAPQIIQPKQHRDALCDAFDFLCAHKTAIVGTVSIATGGVILATATTPMAVVTGTVGIGASVLSVEAELGVQNAESKIEHLDAEIKATDHTLQYVIQQEMSPEFIAGLREKRAMLGQKKDEVLADKKMCMMIGTGASAVGLANFGVSLVTAVPESLSRLIDVVGTVRDITDACIGVRDLSEMFSTEDASLRV